MSTAHSALYLFSADENTWYLPQTDRARVLAFIVRSVLNFLKVSMASQKTFQSSQMQRSFKIVLVGPTHCGKTSLINRFVNGQFNVQIQATTQAAFYHRRVQSFGFDSNLDIWDTAGQERFHALAPMFYRDADGALVVFDLTDEPSLNGAKQWASELRQHRGHDCPIVLVANKSDLRDLRKAKMSEAMDWAVSHSYDYFETSAKTGANVEHAFIGLLRMITHTKRPSSESLSPTKRRTTVRFDDPVPSSDDSCC
jgi:small GTP-binding protein